MTQIRNIKAVFAAAVLSAAAGLLLWFTLFAIPFLPIFFGIAINIPVLFVVFSSCWRDGLVSAVLASFLLCLIAPLEPALLLAAFFFIPALFTGWLLGLQTHAGSNAEISLAGIGLIKQGRRAAPPKAPQFYPLPAAIFQLALAVALVTIAVLFYSFSTTDSIAAVKTIASRLATLVEKKNFYDILGQDGDMNLAFQRLLPILLAVSLALYGFLFQLAAIYGAMRLARHYHRLKRPFGYWPADLRLPPMALFLFIGLWIVSYFIGNISFTATATLALCLNVILAVLAAGFCVSGLAVLHQTARGPWLWLRLAVYVCLFSLVLTPIIFFGLVIMGLFATPFSSPKAHGGSPLL